MDKLTRRIRCNPDGSMLLKRWDNAIVVKGRQDLIYETETGFEQTGSDKLEFLGNLADEEKDTAELYAAHENRSSICWETDIDYY